MDFNGIVTALTNHPDAAFLTLAILAIGYLYRARERDAEAHRATLERVIPVAEKLADGVSTLERLMLKGEH